MLFRMLNRFRSDPLRAQVEEAVQAGTGLRKGEWLLPDGARSPEEVAAIAEAIRLISEKRGWGNVPLRDAPRMQAVVAEATAEVERLGKDAVERLEHHPFVVVQRHGDRDRALHPPRRPRNGAELRHLARSLYRRRSRRARRADSRLAAPACGTCGHGDSVR